MKIRKENIVKLLLILIGIFCQINPLISRNTMMIYLLFCFFLFALTINIKKINFNKGFVWYLIFVLFCLFTLTYTINRINPEYVYIRIFTYLILLLLSAPFLKEEKNVRTVVEGFLIGGLIGITYVLINQYNLIGIRRIGGNLYGSYAEFGAVCALAMTSFLWLQRSMKKKKILKFFLFFYIAFAIIVSGARKAILIAILIPLFMQLFDKRKRIEKKMMFLLIMSILSLIILTAILNNKYLYKTIGYRIESGISSIINDSKEDSSLDERNSFKKLAFELFKERPVFGWGIHGFAMKNYTTHGNILYYLLYSHDGFLEILSCYGLIGFILYYWIFVYIIYNYKKMLYDDTSIFLFSYIIVILLMELYSISFLNSYYVIMIGASANIIEKRKNND